MVPDLDQTNDLAATSLDALRAMQLQRVKATLKRVYERVPLYRRKFEAAGVHPDDLDDLGDLARFPFTSKADLREGYPFGMFAVPVEEIVRVHVSSGTTGKPTVVGYTRRDIDMWAALIARSLRAMGARPGDKAHMAFGYGLFTGGLGFHYGAERLGLTVIPASGGFTDRQVRLIADFRPDVLFATPSYALVIADAFDRAGCDPAGCGIRLGVFGAEPWSEAMRSELEGRFGLDAFDTYGLSEVIGPGVAQELPGDKGCLTVWEDHFLVEVVDPETGAPVPEGQAGELVFTTLTKEGMPVVRFRSRDLSRLLPPAVGALRRIERVKGRSDDMLIIRGVNVFPSQIEAVLSGEPRLSAQYMLEVRRPARLDELTVRVETRPELGDRLDAGTLGGIARRAEKLIKDNIGVTARVEVVPRGTIERSEGKAKRIIDLRPTA